LFDLQLRGDQVTKKLHPRPHLRERIKALKQRALHLGSKADLIHQILTLNLMKWGGKIGLKG
jgi:hypothetical protein